MVSLAMSMPACTSWRSMKAPGRQNRAPRMSAETTNTGMVETNFTKPTRIASERPSGWADSGTRFSARGELLSAP